jgi:Ala-tRNA(Pro) deacylase
MKRFLDSFGVKYVTISHSPAYTAIETAQSAHIDPDEWAKVVMVKIDDRLAMIVMPADRVLDIDRLRQLTGTDDVRLANEREFNDLFPDCEHGAMPPFGNLFAIPVYADAELERDQQIAFNSGSHSELVKMAYLDWENLVRPTIAALSEPRHQTPLGV